MNTNYYLNKMFVYNQVVMGLKMNVRSLCYNCNLCNPQHAL